MYGKNPGVLGRTTLPAAVFLDEAVDIEVEAARSLGIRAPLTRGSMNLSQEDGGLPPKSVVQDADAILADSERVIDAYHDPRDGAFVRIALAPCSPFFVTRDIMRETASLAECKRAGLHTHLAETQDETAFCENSYGCRPLEYLENLGWLGDRTWLAHGIFFTEEEISRLGRTGTGVAHCPGSNMVLGSGLCPALELEAPGHLSASEDASNMIQEIRIALQVQRLRYGASRIGHRDVLRWATEGSAACLGRSDIGRIEAGYQADLALFRLDEPRFSGAHDPLAALVLCGAHRADRVMVGGIWRVVDGEIKGLDLNALMTQHSTAARSLLLDHS